MPLPHRVGRNALMADIVCPVFGPKSIMEAESWQEGNPMTHVTRDPIYRLKGQRSRSPNRLTPWPKISHTFGKRRPTNSKLGLQMEYENPHHCVLTSKVKGQGYNVTSSVWRQLVVSYRQTDVCLQLDKEKSRKHQNWLEGCPYHGWHCTPGPRSKVKCQGHQAAGRRDRQWNGKARKSPLAGHIVAAALQAAQKHIT